MNKFAFDLWNVLPAGENVLVAPGSIVSALARATAGARGETLDELLTALGYQHLPALFNDVTALEQEMQKNNITAANALFANQGFEFNPLYLQNFAPGEVQRLNFAGDPDGSRQEINQWVALQTTQRIQNMLGEGTIDQQTQLVIANAVYLKLQWQYQFEAAMTRQMDFQLLNGATTPVQMMHQTVNVLYIETESFKAIVLPYTDTKMYRLYVVPQKGVHIEQVEQEVAQMGLEALVGRMRQTELDVYVPKFELRWGTSDLTSVLQAMGINEAFGNSANFTGIPADGNNRLYVSGVYHQAWGKDDEVGSEMAAATIVVMRSKGISLKPVFIADRPFMFFNILPTNSGLAPVFMGRLVNPNG